MSQTSTDPGTTPTGAPATPTSGEVDPMSGAPMAASPEGEEVEDTRTDGEKQQAAMMAVGLPIYPSNDPLFKEATGVDPVTGERTPELEELIARDAEQVEKAYSAWDKAAEQVGASLPPKPEGVTSSSSSSSPPEPKPIGTTSTSPSTTTTPSSSTAPSSSGTTTTSTSPTSGSSIQPGPDEPLQSGNPTP